MRVRAPALLLNANLLLASGLLAQTDPRDILLNARRRVTESTGRLSKYMCTVTVDRLRYATNIRRHLADCDEPANKERKPVLQSEDRLRLDVAISPVREMYTWHDASRFDDRDLLDIVNEGAISTGEFGAHLTNIFASDAATFTYNGDHTDLDGHPVAEFSYTVPQERSAYHFGNRQFQSAVAYGGTFLVDTRTFEVLRITIHTSQLPEETGACSATTTLDLARVPINSFDLLLPKSASIRIVMRNGNENENRETYSQCHEFHADTELRFDGAEPFDATSPQPPGNALRAPPLNLPDGLEFRLKLAEKIDSATAAAGDPVRFTLSSALRDLNGAVIPAGTVVRGRIMRVQHDYGSRPRLTIALRLETIEAMGKVRPFAGQGPTPVQRFNAGEVSFTRQRVQLGTLDSIENRDVAALVQLSPGSNYVFRAGTEMKWYTLRPRTAAGSTP